MSDVVSKEHAARARQLGEELGRELPARTVLFQQAIAEQLGLSITDYRCLELAQRADDGRVVTAGQLAELTTLTTGAITGVLDRLERAGFVRREKDPQDRRQVLVRLVPERAKQIEALFTPFQQAWSELCAGYSDQQLSLIGDFIARTAEVFSGETERLRRDHGPTAALDERDARDFSSPLDGARSGKLEIARGASNLTLGTLRGGLLYRLRSDGPVPKVSARDGHVIVEYGRTAFRMFDFRRHVLLVDLSEKIPWELALRGGANKLRANLRGLKLSGLELEGGANDVTLELPHASGTVRVRIAGGASQLRVLRPKDTAARLYVSHGVSGLTIDTLRLGAVGGETRWETPNFGESSDRYDIEVSGGASDLVIATS